MDSRDAATREFLKDTRWASARTQALAGDASARRFFRLRRESGETAILMASPHDIAPFINVAEHLAGLGLSAPNIMASSRSPGLVLMEDFGDDLFARIAERVDERRLYKAAVDVLIKLDGARIPKFAPVFPPEDMCRQSAPAYEWYAPRASGLDQTAGFNEFRAGLHKALFRNMLDGTALLLRDYHAENLIWLARRSGVRRVGILDFQDAMAGPRGYDLASLLSDARRDIRPEIARDMVSRFAAGTGIDRRRLDAALAVIGLQRNIRILGIFARLAAKDGKMRYIDFIPRVWMHVQSCLKHPSLAHLAAIVERDFPSPDAAALRRLKASCSTK